LTERLESKIDAQPAKGDFRFAAAVAAFSMKLRDSDYLGDMRMDEIAKLAESSLMDNSDDQRREFVSMVQAAESLSRASYHRHAP
jgi:Ca-activated chloride channel family protein